MLRGGPDDADDVGPDRLELAVFQPSDVEHHVDFGGSISDGKSRLVSLGIDMGRPEGEPHDRSDPDAAPIQYLVRLGDAVRVQTGGGALVPPRDLARHQDVVMRGRGIEQRVIDHGGELRPRPSPAHGISCSSVTKSAGWGPSLKFAPSAVDARHAGERLAASSAATSSNQSSAIPSKPGGAISGGCGTRWLWTSRRSP